MEFRNYVPGEKVTAFYSNSRDPFYFLSNFAFVEEGIEYDGTLYPSVEHAFQAQKYIKSQRTRFSTTGDLGNWDSIKLVQVKSKRNFWFKKNNIGIIAKMATSTKIGKRLGLIRDASFNSSFELWYFLLEKKYLIKKFYFILKNTENQYLLEFDKGARNRGSVWGGIIQNDVLYFDNLMGKYLMKIRENI